MTRKNWMTIALIVTAPIIVSAAEPVEINYEVQRLDARFRLFKTSNTWNFLELDTETGRVWQVQFSVGEKDERLKIEVRPEVITKGGNQGASLLFQHGICTTSFCLTKI